jgi:hypothetical protein
MEMLPLKAVVEGLLDGEVIWDAASRSISAQVDGKVASLRLNDALVLIVQGRAFVPKDYITRNFIS